MKNPAGNIGRTGVSTLPSTDEPSCPIYEAHPELHAPRFMSVKQLAEYLQLNEKKIYALASEGRIPGTKVTGKWLFPKDLVDQWLLESTHGGVMTDRLILAGSDDPLLHRVITALAGTTKARALVSYSCTGTALGLSLLARRRADVCGIHWGPVEESHHRHPALLRNHPEHRQWLLVRAFHREQGLMLSPDFAVRCGDVESVFSHPLRWAMRQAGAGSHRYLQDIAARYGTSLEKLQVATEAFTEREAGAAIAMGEADVAPGTRSAACEFGLGFVSVGWEAFDLALPRGTYFRTLFQKLLDELRGKRTRDVALALGGYDFRELGTVVWSPETG